MPMFKKSPSDSGQMSENNKKVLHRCRILFIKDLDTPSILDYMSAEEGFKQDLREQLQAIPSREQRVGVFLDRLETKGDRAFSLFMEAVKENYKHVHYVLEESLRNIHEMDEFRHNERTALSGDTVRKVLRTNMKRKVEHSHVSESCDELDIFVDDKDEEKYIDCYAIPMRGRLQTERWIKHVTVPKKEDGQQVVESTYMATLMSDLMFQPVEQDSIPKCVKQPPKYCRVFIVDSENKYGVIPESSPPSVRKHDRLYGRPSNASQITLPKSFAEVPKEAPPDVPSAPPVPPKPGHLPPLMLRPPSLKTRSSLRRTSAEEQKPLPQKSSSLPQPSASLPQPSASLPQPSASIPSVDACSGRPPMPLPDGEVPPRPLKNSIPEGDIPESSPPPPPRTTSKQTLSEKTDATAERPKTLPKPKVLPTSNSHSKMETLINGHSSSPEEETNGNDTQTIINGDVTPTNAKIETLINGDSTLLTEVKDSETKDQSCEKSGHSENGTVKETEFPVENGDVSDCETTPIVEQPPDVLGNIPGLPNGKLATHEDPYPGSTISTCTSTQTLTYEPERRLEDIQSLVDETYEAVGPKSESDSVVESPTFASHDHEVLSFQGNHTDIDHSGSEFSKEGSPEKCANETIPIAQEECSKLSGDSVSSSDNKSSMDSGVDTVSSKVQMAYPPKFSTRPVPHPPVPIMLPRSLSEVHVRADENYNSSNDGSYYEDIDTFDNLRLPSPGKTSSSYLDPKSYIRSFERAMLAEQYPRHKSGTSTRNATLREWESAGKVILRRGDLLIADADVVCEARESSGFEDSCSEAEKDDEDQAEDRPDPLKSFRDTLLTFDKQGRAFFVPSKYLKKFGDPEGEPWFYPVDMTSRQAALFLSMEKQEGCFVVYRPSNKNSSAAYNLSLCRGNGDIVHYHIVENIHGDVMLEGHDHSFMNIRDLVSYFRKNKSQLATRLRRPLKEARMPITPGYHYEMRFELDRNALNLTGKIIGKGNFGVVCAGIYHNIPVAVKVLQKGDMGVTEEDDFIDEAKVMMGLKYDHVVRLIGISCTSRPFFLVTEYMPKGNLNECLRTGTIAVDNIDILFDVCIQTASAMYFLESQKYIIHRDVAARNFLLTDDMCVKLADFGRARQVSDDYYQAPRSETIAIRWAAPEVLMDSVYSTRSDVWSLGVLFWEVFSGGERPYGSLSAEQNVIYVTEGGRLDKPPGCPTDLYALMRGCWREYPDERPTFTQLYDKLKSKTSIYYSGPVQSKRTSGGSNKSNSLTMPPPVKTPPARPTTPSSKTNRRTMTVDSRTEDFFEQMKLQDLEVKRGSRERLPTSSSETSLVSGNTDIKEELTRSEKIRKSLRKLVNVKQKRKSNKPDASPIPKYQEDRGAQGPFYYGQA